MSRRRNDRVMPMLRNKRYERLVNQEGGQGDKMQYGLYVHGMVTADDDGGTGLDMGGRRGSW